MDVLRAGLAELVKLGEIDLAGISHATVMRNVQGAPPMETTGLTTALKVLDRYQGQQEKLAAPRVPFNPDLPQINKVTGAKKKGKKQKDVVEHTKSLSGHAIGGAGAGRFIGEFVHGPKAPVSNAAKKALHGKKYWGTVAGAGVGLAEYGRKRIAEKLRERKEKAKTAAFSPAMQLKRTKQVASTLGQKTGTGLGPISRPTKIRL